MSSAICGVTDQPTGDIWQKAFGRLGVEGRAVGRLERYLRTGTGGRGVFLRGQHSLNVD